MSNVLQNHIESIIWNPLLHKFWDLPRKFKNTGPDLIKPYLQNCTSLLTERLFSLVHFISNNENVWYLYVSLAITALKARQPSQSTIKVEYPKYHKQILYVYFECICIKEKKGKEIRSIHDLSFYCTTNSISCARTSAKGF